MSEIVKGVSMEELIGRHEAGDDIEDIFKDLAEKHAQAVLEDYIKNQTPVSTTFAGKYEYTLPKPDKPIFIYNHDPIGRVEVNDSSPMPLSDEDIKSALRGAIKAIEDKHLCGKDFFCYDLGKFGKIKVQKMPEVDGKEPADKDTPKDNFPYKECFPGIWVPSGDPCPSQKEADELRESLIQTPSCCPEFAGKDAVEKEAKPQPSKFKVGDPDSLYGRVYSDLEGNGDKESSAKTEERKPYEFTKEEWDKFPNIGFVLPDWLKDYRWHVKVKDECCLKEEQLNAPPPKSGPESTHAFGTIWSDANKNRYGIGQKVFVTDQNEILECVIQEISEEEDGLILYTAYDDYGVDYKLMEEEVFTTVDELLSYLRKSAEEL